MSKLSKYLDSQFRADLDVLFLRWLRPVTSAELRKGYALCLTEAIADNAHFWLMDFRSRGAAEEEDAQWVIKEFLPEAEKALPGKCCIALLLTPDYEKFVDQTIGLNNLLHFSKQTSIKSFFQEGEALNWLKACQNGKKTKDEKE